VGLKAQLYAASGIYMGQQRRNGIHLALTGQLSLYPFLGICQYKILKKVYYFHKKRDFQK